MNTSLFIGIRFLLGKKTTRFLSLVTKVSIFGLTLGVIALVIVVSVMNGFDSQLKYRILGAVPHVVVADKPAADDSLIKGTARFLSFQGMVLANENRLVAIYGIDPAEESRVSVIPAHIADDSLKSLIPGSNNVIVGSALAARLGIWPQDKATLLVPVASASGATIVPKIGKVTVQGTFRLESELDYGLILMHVEDLANLTGVMTSDYRVTLHDVFSVRAFEETSNAVVRSTWYDEYGDFFATVKMEKLMMFLLLTMIVMIAAFNTVSGLSMIVTEKQAEIAVLRSMGMTRRQIMSIFVIQGGAIGIGGVLLGLLIGLPIAYHVSDVVGFFENLAGGRMLAGTYFDRVPSDVRWFDIALIALVSFAIALLSTLYPAYRAARLEPAQVLRTE